MLAKMGIVVINLHIIWLIFSAKEWFGEFLVLPQKPKKKHNMNKLLIAFNVKLFEEKLLKTIECNFRLYSEQLLWNP